MSPEKGGGFHTNPTAESNLQNIQWYIKKQIYKNECFGLLVCLAFLFTVFENSFTQYYY